MTSGVYLVTCSYNGWRYVGSSSVIEARFFEHLSKALRASHHSRTFQADFDQFGANAFSYVVLEEVATRSELKIREQVYIDALHPEYNISPFANRPTNKGKKASPATLKQMSESNQRVWDALTPEDRKARGAKTRHPNSPEHLARLRKANAAHAAKRQAKRAADRIEWEAGRADREQARREKLRIANLGKVQSEEAKAKLRAVAEAQQADPEYKAKHQQAVSEAMQRPEVVARHREGIANRPPMSETHKANIGKAHKGMKRPAGTGEKIAASKRGKKHSPETIEKLKAAQQARQARARAEKEKKK
jgi:group I intron endonuclease